MSDDAPAPTVEGVPLDASMVEGRLTMSVELEPATVRLATPRHDPLSRREIHLSVELVADGVSVMLRFNADEAAALLAGLEETVPAVVRADVEDAPDVDLFDPDGGPP